MLERRWVLITGATSGIGLTTAVYLALQGYEVIATGRSEDKLAVVQKAAEAAKVTIRRVILDVTDEQSVATMKDEVLAMTNGYGIDVLVNNAGYAEGGAMEDIPIQRLRSQFETNVIGLVAVSQAFLPFMRTRRSGRIINISSVVGKLTIPLMGAYTASKHAVESVSEAMRMELRNTGVDVVIVAPGAISSNFGNTATETVQSWVAPDSPYHAAYQKWMRDRRRERGASSIVIAKAVHKAILANRPRVRYAAPLESRLAPLFRLIMPKRAADAILERAIMGKR